MLPTATLFLLCELCPDFRQHTEVPSWWCCRLWLWDDGLNVLKVVPHLFSLKKDWWNKKLVWVLHSSWCLLHIDHRQSRSIVKQDNWIGFRIYYQQHDKSILPKNSTFLCNGAREQFTFILNKNPLSHFQKWISILFFWFHIAEVKCFWAEASAGKSTKAGHFLGVDKAWFSQYQLKAKRKWI